MLFHRRGFCGLARLHVTQSKKKMIFSCFAQNIDCEYTLEPRLWIKNKRNRYTLQTPVLLYESGFDGGILCTDMFS